MQQRELFSTKAIQTEDAPEMPGFRLVGDYIDARTEQELLAHIDPGPWQSDFRRRVQQYGLGYAGGSQKLSWVRDFPSWLLRLAQRVAEDAPMERFPENCVINEYIPPQGIGPHRDYPDFGPTVSCVSLGSDIVMDFSHEGRRLRVPVHVPARSLWVLSGEARWEWTHGIAPRLKDIIKGERRARGRRVSVTFRTARDPTVLSGC